MALFERVHMASFAGATEWLNSEPLGPAGLRGRRAAVAHGCFRMYASDGQRQVAEDTIADVDASGLWPGNVVTETGETAV